jgi:hypothetical protein
MSVVLIPGLIPCLALRWAMAPIAHKQKVRVSPRVYIFYPRATLALQTSLTMVAHLVR